MNPDAPRQIPVYVVLSPQALMLDLAGPLDVLRYANMAPDQCSTASEAPVPCADSVLTSVGLTLSGIEPFPLALPDDALVVLVGDVDDVLPATRNMPRDEMLAQQEAIVEWLKAMIRPGHVLVSICSGALLAARAGLLDGYTCTTHYIDCRLLATLAPQARVLDNRLYVEDRDRLTSAGVTAGIDLMLYLVSRYIDHACALAVARYLVVYLRRGGGGGDQDQKGGKSKPKKNTQKPT